MVVPGKYLFCCHLQSLNGAFGILFTDNIKIHQLMTQNSLGCLLCFTSPMTQTLPALQPDLEFQYLPESYLHQNKSPSIHQEQLAKRVQTWLKDKSLDRFKVQVSSKVKSLCFTLNSAFTFKCHIIKKTKMTWYQLSVLKKRIPFLPESDLRTALQVLVPSHLDGGIVPLHGFLDFFLVKYLMTSYLLQNSYKRTHKNDITPHL